MTNETICDRINKLSGERRTPGGQRLYLVNWITQRRNEHLGQLYGLFKLSCIRRTNNSQRNSWVILLEANYSKTWFEALRCFRYNFLRVWSWLRTNAGGVPNTCKSNGVISFGRSLSGERVSNAWETCLSVGDNSWKRLLIPHNILWGHPLRIKA